MSSDDLPPASGRGAEHFDVPTRFYLTNREDIERWAALGKTASNAIHKLHLGMEDDVAEIAERVGLTGGLFRTGSNYRTWLLSRPDTPVGSDTAPMAAIGLRWHRHNTVIDEPKLAARAGVRISDRTVREDFLELDGGLRPIRDGHGYKSDTFWPIYRSVPRDGAWWSDLDAYREQLMEHLADVVALFEPRLRQLPGQQ